MAALIRQGESEQRISGLLSERAMAASGDDNILPAFGRELVSLRGAKAASRQAIAPQDSTSIRIDGAEFVVDRRRDEGEAATGLRGAAQIGGTGSELADQRRLPVRAAEPSSTKARQ
jgi:hypothetical protein